MLQAGDVFLQNDTQPLLLPKQGLCIYKEGKEKQVRGLPRTGVTGGGGIPRRRVAAGFPAISGQTCHGMGINGANVSVKSEKKFPTFFRERIYYAGL